MIENWKDCPPITYGGTCAFYRPSEDIIGLPGRERFENAEEFYSAMFHEVTHSTGHKKRLNREGIAKPNGFGTNPYAKEELVAEFGAAFLCAHCGIDRGNLENSAAYLRAWITKLENDSRLAVKAATLAQEAADLVIKGGKSKKKSEKDREAA